MFFKLFVLIWICRWDNPDDITMTSSEYLCQTWLQSHTFHCQLLYWRLQGNSYHTNSCTAAISGAELTLGSTFEQWEPEIAPLTLGQWTTQCASWSIVSLLSSNNSPCDKWNQWSAPLIKHAAWCLWNHVPKSSTTLIYSSNLEKPAACLMYSTLI